MLTPLSKFKGAALNPLFPQKCIGCGEEGNLLCRSCIKTLPRIVPPICPRCGRPQPSGITCPVCVTSRSSIDGIRSPFKFEGVAREAVHQLKYKNLRSLAAPLAALLGEYLSRNPIPAEILVPVPLHPKRMRERGYNQSGLLANELGKLLGLPVDDNCLVRRKYVLPQARTQSVEERKRNMQEAFACVNSRLRGRQILLIDDVSTSGATLDACATALKSAGVRSIWGLVLTREI